MDELEKLIDAYRRAVLKRAVAMRMGLEAVHLWQEFDIEERRARQAILDAWNAKPQLATNYRCNSCGAFVVALDKLD